MQMQGELELELELPPGFRFHPTDDELVNHYLCRKCAAQSIAVPIIKEIDLYKFDPWHLPEMGGGNGNGEKEWYFFSPRDRKYPNGSRPNRAAGNGYWKATGADKAIGKLGIKKALVFYAGKAPKGVKTNWIMHEYRLANVDRSQPKKINNLRLDDWVLCRIYNKKGKIEKYDNSVSVDQKAPPPQQIKNDMYNQIDFRNSQLLYQIDSSDYSSCSVSPDVNKEVQSEPKWNELELELELGPAFDFHFNFMDNNDDINMPSDDDPFAPPFQINQPSPFQDILMFFQHS